ncbi:MAG: M15 family metallopeptidase [Gordonia sp. (in: high G+C Gram-positive bacteria)]
MSRFPLLRPSVAVVAVAAVAGCGPSDTPEQPSSTTSSTRTSATSSSTTTLPPVNDAARAAGFVDVRTVVPDAVIDLRYATPNNFVGVALYPENARCLVHESMAPGLAAASATLREHGERLVFWDCYRPHSVQQRMFDRVPNPAWVAEPGPYSRSHEAGRSVDVTLAAPTPTCLTPRVDDLCPTDMGTDFDAFTPQAGAFAVEGVSAAARAARARLRTAMAANGLSVYAGEWWHFDGPGADVERPIIDVPLT